jgi:hypothetical protein
MEWPHAKATEWYAALAKARRDQPHTSPVRGGGPRCVTSAKAKAITLAENYAGLPLD